MRRSALVLLLVLLPVAPALAEPDSFGLGTGRNGVLAVSTQNRVINNAQPLAAGVSAGHTELSVSSASDFAASGQLVLIHQSAGLPETTVSGQTAALTPGALGRWELARVASVANGVLRLTAPLMNGYTLPGAQVVTVPEYTNVSVQAGASLVAPAWNGRSGGILAFLANDALSNQGVISASGAGFRGGPYLDHANLTGCLALDEPPERGGAYKGEGLVVNRFGTASGRGNLANAGGGGNCHNSGGGGGGHGGFGGTGGRTADVDNIRDMGGLGGVLVRYQPVEQFVFGGGAGSGEGNNDAGSPGAAGGGAVLIRARRVGGSGSFLADGAAGLRTPGDDGAGGGGAGGAVILRVAEAVACGGAYARGGAGGNTTAPGFPLGPGGGGGGGYVLVQGETVLCPLDVAGGAAGTTAADGGTHGSTYGAGAGGVGFQQELLVAYRTPMSPALTSPESGAVGVSSRPRFEGVADPGVRVIISVNGAEVTQAVADSVTGEFSVPYPSLRDPLEVGEQTVTLVAESLAAYSQPSAGVTFNVATSLADGGVLVAPILVVPADGEAVGPTPLFAGYAPNGVSVGIEVDELEEVEVPLDSAGRFRYQWPSDNPLPPGPHFVVIHAHNEENINGPYSQMVRFEALSGGGEDAGTEPPDAGTQEPDAGTEPPDAGTNGNPDAGPLPPEVPVIVVPASAEVVDPTPLFAGAAEPGASVVIRVDGTALATVTADATGAFRYQVRPEEALALGTHRVSAHARVSATQTDGPGSEEVSFEVRGPAALDVGCGCGASPAGVAGVWALLAGLSAAARRRRR